jgi:3-hydroxyisobutyrate dehydrogenase
MAKMHVGFVGTGIMGAPMARNLLKAGFTVTAQNRTRAKAEALEADGATVVDTPAAAAEGADAVITIVSDSPDVEAVYLGDDGICSTIGRGKLTIDMSTISPMVAREVAKAVEAKGASFLDAPVSGGEGGAIGGTLSIMIGGPTEAVERARPLFEAMGKNIVHIGENGAGQLTKLCNQTAAVLTILGAAEAVALAEKSGLDVGKMLEAIGAGAAGSWMISNLAPLMAKKDYRPGFMIDLQQKDLRLVMETARAFKLSMPGASLVHQLYASNQAAGEGAEGTQSMIKTLRRLGAI